MATAFMAESPENYEQKCCCTLVLDVSGSMAGDPINQLNKGLQDFYSDIQKDSTTENRLEIAIVEFSDSVTIRLAPSLISSFSMPILTTNGTTRLADGVNEAINVVRDRKNWYKQTGQPYYRPWVILITDGAPDSDQNIPALANDIQNGVRNKDFFFFAIGVAGADMNMLARISDPSMPPAMLQGLRFAEFFKWLSASMTTVTNSKDNATVNLPDPANWMKGFKV